MNDPYRADDTYKMAPVCMSIILIFKVVANKDLDIHKNEFSLTRSVIQLDHLLTRVRRRRVMVYSVCVSE